MPTKVMVIGGSGPTGRLVLARAADAGLEPIAFQHRPFEVPNGTEIRAGDLLDPSTLPSALRGCDAVVSLVGHGKGSPSDLASRAYRNLVAVMRDERVGRLVCVTGALIGHPRELRHGFYRIAPDLFSQVVREQIADRQLSERIVMESGLDWTIVRPPRLVDGPLLPLAVAPDMRIGTMAHCTRASLAQFLVDEVSAPRHRREAIAVRTVASRRASREATARPESPP